MEEISPIRAAMIKAFGERTEVLELVDVPEPTGPAASAATLGSSCGEEAGGLFGELFKKLEVRAVPGIRVEDQPGIR
jgi:hypothetical protein